MHNCIIVQIKKKCRFKNRKVGKKFPFCKVKKIWTVGYHLNNFIPMPLGNAKFKQLVLHLLVSDSEILKRPLDEILQNQ